MKIFTRVMLILSGVLATLGVICIIIACSMGLTWGNFVKMLNEGKFRIDIADKNGIHIDFFGIDINTGLGDGESGNIDVSEVITGLDVEFGAGILDIHYGDVEEISIEYEYVIGFESRVKDGTLHLSGALGIGDNSNGALTIVIPYGTTFEKVDLEIGASEAKINDIVATEVDISVGVGEAEVKNLTVEDLDIETGVGQLAVELKGKEKDYSYSLDCGIGKIVIGENSYGGLGASHSVKNEDASCHMDIECGIGTVRITFTE